MKMDQKGFTLLELLIALTVLAVVAVPVFSSMVLAAQYTGRNDLQADCLRIAENEMELQRAAGTKTATDATDEAAQYRIKPLTGGMADEKMDAEGNLTRVPDGIYTNLQGISIKVEAIPLEGNLYTVTVTVTPPLDDGGNEQFPEIELKGVVKYGTP